MSTPNSTELQDRFTRVLEAIDVAREASAVRDNLVGTVRHDSDELLTARRNADAAWGLAGVAEWDMREAIRAAATVLDHAHTCDQRLVHENARLSGENAALREQVETLGGNSGTDYVAALATDTAKAV